MLPEHELFFHPNIVDCLAWSEDGELAIAAGEFVHILIPRRQNQDKKSPGPWEHVQFRVNTFTNRQWRPLEPAGFDDFSIGEEQSSSAVVALAWSPPGLSKHQRSVLAILTSNLLLSFWARTSDSKINSGWQRVLVVNNAIKKSWSRRSYVPQESDETSLQQKLRIRNMTWAPHARRPSVNANHFEARWGTFLLAIANDDNEVLILLISSPFMNNSNSWDSKIVKLISFDEKGPLIDGDVQSDALIRGSTSIELSLGEVTNGSTAAGPYGGSRGAAVRPQSLFKSAIESKRFVDSIAWGYWDCRADKVETILTFLHSGNVFHCVFDVFFLFPEYTVLSSVPRFHIKQSFKCKKKENNPSCCRAVWYHLKPNEDPLAVVCSRGEIDLSFWSRSASRILLSENGLYRFKPHEDRWEDEKTRGFDLVWDQISGVTFCTDGDEEATYLYSTTILSHFEVIRVRKPARDAPDSAILWDIAPQPALQKRMLQLHNQFDNQNELGGLSIMKTWGLASANGYIAACITLHPGDMPEYVTPAQERATVVFSVLGLNDVDPNPERFSWEMDPAIENGNTKPQIVILDTTLEFECEGSYEPNEFGNKIIYAAAMATMLMWDTGRLRRLRFAQDALQRLERAVEMELKSEMDCIRELLSDDFHMEEGITKTKEATSSRNKEELFQLAAQRLLDICPFCAQIIPWESVTEAWCIAGHQFARCNLTFLPITSPHISKSCTSCSRIFLSSPSFTSAQDSSTASPRLSAPSTTTDSSIPPIEHLTDPTIFPSSEIEKINNRDPTARIDRKAIERKRQVLGEWLFERWDLCPYCNGRFSSGLI